MTSISLPYSGLVIRDRVEPAPIPAMSDRLNTEVNEGRLARRANLPQPTPLISPPITCIFPRHPVPQEGRFAVVTNVGYGMRWTPWRRQTSGAVADGEVVWS